MTDSPTSKKRFGAGTCWEYMQRGRGACTCDTATVRGSHPTLSVAAAESSASCSSGTVVSMPRHIPEWIESLKYLGFVEGDPNNFAVLDTTYEEREDVKRLGASFSPGMKKWIVVQGQDLAPFASWKPRIHGRGGEVVFHNPNIDIVSAVSDLQRCGLHPSHFDIIRGNDEEVSALKYSRDYITGDSKEEQSGVVDLCSVDTAEKKRKFYKLNLNEQQQRAATTGGDAKRPHFPSPESLQTLARLEQVVHGKVQESTTESEEQEGNNLSALLSTAKSALARCDSAGGIDKEQMQFNVAICNVLEAIVVKLDSIEKKSNGKSVSASNSSPAKYANPWQKMAVTPTASKDGNL